MWCGLSIKKVRRRDLPMYTSQSHLERLEQWLSLWFGRYCVHRIVYIPEECLFTEQIRKTDSVAIWHITHHNAETTVHLCSVMWLALRARSDQSRHWVYLLSEYFSAQFGSDQNYHWRWPMGMSWEEVEKTSWDRTMWQSCVTWCAEGTGRTKV